MIRPVWEARRLLVNSVQAHFGGGTSSNPVIPPEFAPLINASVGHMVAQQGANPIGQYNGSNPMGTEGLTPAQQMAMGVSAGNLQNNPLQYLAAQAAQRAAGMSGAGPTTGSYDPSGEMGLQDWAQLMNPYFGQGGEMGNQVAPTITLGDAAGSNVNPQGGPGVNYQGGPPNMSATPPGSPGTSGGALPGADLSPAPPPAPGQSPGNGGGAPQFYRDPSGNLRVADPSQAGRVEGTNVHGQGVVNSQGMLQQFFMPASQGQAPAGGAQLGRGSMTARPTDPAAAAAWDRVMRAHPGATVSNQQAATPQGVSMQDVMSDPRGQAYANAYAHRFDAIPTAANNWGRGSASPAPSQAASQPKKAKA